MIKTIISLFTLLTLFSMNTFAANSPPRQKGVLKADSGEVFSVAFSPDSRSVASGCGWPRYRINLWDVMSGQPKSPSIVYIEEATLSVAFSPDGNTLASGSWNKTVHLWDVASGQLKAVLTGHSERVNSVAFSPDSSILASGSLDKTVRLWNMVSGQPKAILIGHTDNVLSVAFSPDGSTLASGSHDRTVRLWDVASEQPKTVLIEHTFGVSSVAFSPDGSILASGSGDTVHLWDVASGQRKTVPTGHSDSVRSIMFSPDGSTLASASDDRTVRLWDMASGQLIAVLIGHTDRVTSVAFSPDGSTLASGGDREDRTVILWDLTASATTSAIVRISPSSVQSPSIGEQLTVPLNIVGGENVRGYQATVGFDPTALLYFSSDNGEYLSDGAFFAAPTIEKNYVTLVSAATRGSNGDGTLATITFQVVDAKASELFLSQTTLVDSDGERLFPCIENGTVGDDTMEDGAVIESVYRAEDINDDGVVNIQDLVLVSANFGRTRESKADVNGDGVVDIVDLVKVAAALGNTADAPSVHPQTLPMLTAADVQNWLIQAQGLTLTDETSRKGILLLEHLLAVLTPKETILLSNYPNPFNPETWIPYQLANPSDVQIIIYDMRGITIRRLVLGHQPAGYYTTHGRAAHWDGRNDLGERVATGVYFYQLQADDMSILRKMVILK